MTSLPTQGVGTSLRPSGLTDSFGRRLEYLRLSLTDRCNYRCAYCMPGGCPNAAGPEAPLGVDEIGRLVSAFAALGFWKLRLTGGEPTLRRDLVEVVERVAAVPGVTRVGLSTNGYRLARLAVPLRRAGLAALNVSVDSLDPARFEWATGVGQLEDVVDGVETAVAAGFPDVKVNVVLMRDAAAADLDALLGWAEHLPITVRFIELMRTEDNAEFFDRHHVPAAFAEEALRERGWRPRPRSETDGVAAIFVREGSRGRAGVIAPYSRGFCGRCNRLRVSSSGGLRLCLFGDRDIPLRHLLASDDQRDELIHLIVDAARVKPAGHALRQGSSGSTTTLGVIGG